MIGIDGRAALVAGKDVGSVNPKFFSLSQFTHTMVALAKPDGTTQWIDPTISYAPFGFEPWKDSGAGALLLKGKEGELIDIPQKNEANITRYAVTLKPRSDGKADIEMEAQYIGEDAIDMREELVPASDAARLSFLQEWLKERRAGAALTAHSIEDLDDAEKPLRIKMTLEAPGLVTLADGILVVHGCVISCNDSNPIPRASRTQPFYVDRGWIVEETVVIEPPPSMSASSMPAAAMARSAIATLNFSCTAQGEGGARCQRQFQARRNRWPASELANVRAMYDKIVQADRSTVAFAQVSATGG